MAGASDVPCDDGRDRRQAGFYNEPASQLRALIGEEQDAIANAANTSALLFQVMPDLNWAGFYLLRGTDELVLGLFQRKPACIRIPSGQGVCGTAVARGHSILVKDVHEFPGHIACDAASRSELVVPLIKNGPIIGVLDLDSPSKARFDPGLRKASRSWPVSSLPQATFPLLVRHECGSLRVVLESDATAQEISATVGAGVFGAPG